MPKPGLQRVEGLPLPASKRAHTRMFAIHGFVVVEFIVTDR